MDPLLAVIIGIALGLVLGVVIGWLVGRVRHASVGGDDPVVLQARHETAIAEVRAAEQAAQGRLAAELASVQATALALRDQLGGLQDQHRDLLERQRAEQLAQQERDRAESKVLQML
ncbi:MAG: DNA recombination protein RmuC, partial [Terrimesophilobacter sp.]